MNSDDSFSQDSIGRQVKGLSNTAHENLDSWPTPDEGALEGDRRSNYLSRKEAVKLYLQGHSEEEIRKACGLGLKHVYRLIVERCLQTHPDGLIYGWRGLVPNKRIKNYTRKSKIKVDAYGFGAAGAMNAVLDAHPMLRKAFDKRILASPKPDELGAVKRPRTVHWKWFLDELRKLGYEQRGEWPFNTETNGYSSVCRYIDRILSSNPRQATLVIGGPDLQKKLTTGDGVDRPVERIFRRVEMDAHKLDGRFCVMMPQVTGGYLPKIVHRIWVIVIIEVYTRAVLGYHMSMRREVSAEDVMRAIKKALSPWRRKRLSFSDLAYRDGAALPSGYSEKFVGICWEETSVDGALAESCKHVVRILKDVVNSELINPESGFSARRNKDDRPFIETFFRKLGANGFQRLSNTTGSNPKGKGGRNPEQVAIASQFQLEYAEELLDVLIANYNSEQHGSLGSRSPLEYMQFVSTRPGVELRYADQDSVKDILSFRLKRRVKGGLKEGRNPYVNFESARYSNETLKQRFDLVGKYIWVVNYDEDDARLVKISTIDGTPLGIARAAPPWHKLPHSLAVRRAIASSVRRRMFSIASGADGVETFLEFCEAQADGKLPVHPAYLEARRILVQQAEMSTGKSMLDIALERIESEANSQTNEPIAKSENSKLQKEPERKNPEEILPARRLAASE